MKNNEINININIESFKNLLKILFIKSQNEKLCLKADFEKEIDLENLVKDNRDKKLIRDFIEEISDEQIKKYLNNISDIGYHLTYSDCCKLGLM